MTPPLPRHGGQLRAIAEQFGLNRADLLDFSANINPDGPPLAALAAMSDALAGGECVTHYPDLHETLLKSALALYAGVTVNEVLVANGFVPLLDATMRALGLRSCALPVPSFNEYRRVLEQNTVSITPILLRFEAGFRYNFEQVLASDSEAVLLANPQNPTGVLCDRTALLDFVAQALQRGKHVLLDEAFIDYAPGNSLAATVQQCPRLVVFRSLTKFFGMPGLRVAYALASKDVTTKIERFLPPWPITTLASAAAAAAVNDQSYIETVLSKNGCRRTFLRTRLEEIGLEVIDGAANFLLFKGADAESCWRNLIMRHGIVLRLCDNYEGLQKGFLRAAVCDENATARLLRSITASVTAVVTRPDISGRTT